MLRPVKREIEAVAARLIQGADSPETLATEIIQLVEQLRGEREWHVLALQLSPGVFAGYGPYATKAAAMKAMPKLPMAQIAKGGVVIPVRGPATAEAALEKADSEVADRGDFSIVREDALAFSRGWSGKERERSKFLLT